MDVGSALRINNAPSPIVPIVVQNESTSTVKVSPTIEVINNSTADTIATLQQKEQFASTIDQPFQGWNTDPNAGATIVGAAAVVKEANITGPVPGITVNASTASASEASPGSSGSNIDTTA